MKIIAEFCQNHNGDLDILKEMIKEASKAGATHAKIQTMFADDLTHRERFDLGQESIKRPYKEEYERLKRLELDTDAHKMFIRECKHHNIIPLTSILVHSYIPFLKELGFKEIKVPSYDCASYPMIRDLKENFKHLYISTGATFNEEIIQTASILGKYNFTFLHCTTIYPTPLATLNMRKLWFLEHFTSNIGFSDHTLTKENNIIASIIALWHKATVIERHFTILPADKTKDGPISINPEQLKQLVDFSKYGKSELNKYVQSNLKVKEVRSSEGASNPCMTLTELCNRDYYRGRFAEKIDGGYKYNWEE